MGFAASWGWGDPRANTNSARERIRRSKGRGKRATLDGDHISCMRGAERPSRRSSLRGGEGRGRLTRCGWGSLDRAPPEGVGEGRLERRSQIGEQAATGCAKSAPRTIARGAKGRGAVGGGRSRPCPAAAWSTAHLAHLAHLARSFGCLRCSINASRPKRAGRGSPGRATRESEVGGARDGRWINGRACPARGPAGRPAAPMRARRVRPPRTRGRRGWGAVAVCRCRCRCQSCSLRLPRDQRTQKWKWQVGFEGEWAHFDRFPDMM